MASSAVKKVVETASLMKQRKTLNLSGMSDREKLKSKLFERYDIERREREFQEVLGENSKYITRPIRRTGLSRYQIDDFKEEVYTRIEKMRDAFKQN